MATNNKMSTKSNSGKVKTESTAEEMLAQFESIKSRKENATDIRVLLPSRAHVENNNLVVRDIANCDGEYASLTENRKEILKIVKDHPQEPQDVIAKRANTSGTSVSRTINNFGFVLDDHRIFKYFVLEQKTVLYGEGDGEENEGAWEVEFDYPTGVEVEEYDDEEEARRVLFHLANAFEEYPVLRNPEGEVVESHGVLDLIVDEQEWTEEAINGIGVIEESHGDIISFFESVNDGGLDTGTMFDDDELFTIFKLLAMQDTEDSDDLARKVAKHI